MTSAWKDLSVTSNTATLHATGRLEGAPTRGTRACELGPRLVESAVHLLLEASILLNT